MKIFFRLLQFSKPYRHYIPEYCIYIFFYIIFGLLNFALIIPLLDVLFETKKQALVTSLPPFHLSAEYFKAAFYYNLNYYIQTTSKISVLAYVCAVMLLFVFLKNLFGFLSQKVLTRMRVNLVKRIREDLFYRYSTQSLQFFHTQKKGNLLSIISNDVGEIETTVVSAIQTLFRDPLVVIATFAFLFYLSPQLTFFTLVFFPVSGLIISSISKRLRKKSHLGQSLFGTILNLSEETISGIRIIKGFNAEDFINRKFLTESDKLARTTKSITNQRELASPLSEFLGVTVIVVIIIYGGYLILEGRSNMTASSFIAYIGFYYQIINPVKNISVAITNLQRGLVAGERVLNILDEPQRIKEKENALPVHAFNHSIHLKNIGFSYMHENVLHNIDLTIAKGKMIALVGESGAGKSTLADLVPRFYDVTEGTILLDDTDIRDLKVHDLRSLMAIVSQEAILFNDSVLNNITFGNTIIDREKAIAAAKAANAHNFIAELEEGYDTMIGDRGMRLSGGQRQRLTIARAIYKNAPILIMDEATSALDTESERLVQDAINKMMENRTSIVIAHRLSTIRHADEIIVLQKGVIVERGTHEQLLDKKGYYYKLVQMQEVK
ncbi:ATP-binding cassette, subfamily B, MsbA [Flavisolibacter ginsengisoli DSM 18119]|jgi:subfamily B ATP-binding cassette protein MsbA|uniref:ATP-binding cassette, subfamily B, MsbA n=1 Tax=Flavisolibacter ginsengisoli DSM 18119 TaxID=1121884 RepID=A0A1M4W1R1_9BACT|nr:ATP-binding cassette, subfamily B, MsbA [Flavisolibacter ginsengisoli DSM 18119]